MSCVARVGTVDRFCWVYSPVVPLEVACCSTRVVSTVSGVVNALVCLFGRKDLILFFLCVLRKVRETLVEGSGRWKSEYDKNLER